MQHAKVYITDARRPDYQGNEHAETEDPQPAPEELGVQARLRPAPLSLAAVSERNGHTHQ